MVSLIVLACFNLIGFGLWIHATGDELSGKIAPFIAVAGGTLTLAANVAKELM